MPAIFTDKYRALLPKQFLAGLTSDAFIAYIFIGRPQVWADTANVSVSDSAPPVPVDTVQQSEFAYWRDMLGAKRMTAANTQFVVERTDWTPGSVYTQYDDVVPAQNNFYVIDTTAEPYKVYKCLWNMNGAPSIYAPSQIGTAIVPTATFDGYVWQYMYTINTGDYPYLTAKWMPVLANTTVQANALTNAGQLPTAVPLMVLAGGAGFDASLPTTTTIIGDGTGATVASSGAVIAAGVISDVTLLTGGLGYSRVTSVNVAQSGATAPTVRAIIPPYPNHGYDPVKELRCAAIMTSTQFVTSESSKLTTANDFRRIGLLLNPQTAAGAVANGAFYRLTTDVTISGNTGAFHPDDVLTNMTKASHPTCTVVDVIGSAPNYVIRVTDIDNQSESTPVAHGDTLRCQGSGSEATANTVSAPELLPFSGDIVFVNQRTPVLRDSAQTEEIKLVFPFK